MKTAAGLFFVMAFFLTSVRAQSYWDSDTSSWTYPVIDTPTAADLPQAKKTLDQGILNIYRLSFWAGDDRPGDPATVGSQFYGARLDEMFKNVGGRHAFGLMVMANGWNNEPIDYRYRGLNGCIGPEAMFSLGSGVYLSADLSVGAQWGWGAGGAGYLYESFKTNGFGRLGAALDAYGRTTCLSIWASGEKTFREAKQSFYNGRRLYWQEDSSSDESQAAGGMRFCFLRNLPVEPLLVCHESYNFYDHGLSISLGAGVRSWEERMTFEICFKSRSNSIYSNNNYNGIESLLCLSFGQERKSK